MFTAKLIVFMTASVVLCCAAAASAALVGTGPQALQTASIANPESWALRQETAMTCWAACNRMVLSKLGVRQTEQEQVQRMTAAMPTGGLTGAGAHFENAKVALGGEFRSGKSQMQMVIPYVAYSSGYNPSDRQYYANAILVNSLKKGIPVITATQQHAVVIYSATYVKSGPVVQIQSIKYIDPMPTSPLLGEMSGPQLTSLIGLMTARIEPVQ